VDGFVAVDGVATGAVGVVVVAGEVDFSFLSVPVELSLLLGALGVLLDSALRESVR